MDPMNRRWIPPTVVTLALILSTPAIASAAPRRAPPAFDAFGRSGAAAAGRLASAVRRAPAMRQTHPRPGVLAAAPDDAAGYTTVGDGAGGFYVAWARRGFGPAIANLSEVFVQRFDANGSVHASWPASGVKVADVAGVQDDAILEPDGSGGVTVAYDSFESGLPTPTVQRLNSSGTRLWNPSGVALTAGSGHYCYVNDLMPDGAGGAYVSWVDLVDLLGAVHSSVQHLDASGNVVSGWPAAGFVLGATGMQQDPLLYHDASTGALAIWEDSRYGPSELFGQHFTAAGTTMWGSADGIPMVDPPIDRDQATDGAGGLLFFWVTDKIYMQRVDSTGTALLGAGGTSVVDDSNIQSAPLVCPDGAGGAVLAWMDDRDALGYVPLYAVRVDGDAATHSGWTHNGVRISDSEPSTWLVKSDGAGGAFIYSSEYPNYPRYDLNVQHVTGAGAIPAGWPLDGVRLTAPAANFVGYGFAGTPNASGGIHTAWWDQRASFTSFDLYGQSVDGSGSLLWDPAGRSLVNELGRQNAPTFALEGGGIGIRWEDKRSGQWNVWGRSFSSLGTALASASQYSTGADDRLDVRVIGDGAGGTFTVWDAYNGTDFDTYAQRAAGGGTPMWAAGGVQVLTHTNEIGPPLLIPDGSGGAIVGQSDQNSSNFLVQRVNSSGSALWTPGGVALASPAQFNAVTGAATDGAHGMFFAFVAQVLDSGNYYNDVHVNRVDATGSVLWGVFGKPVAQKATNRTGQIVAPDGSGGVFVAWSQESLPKHPQIFVQRLDSNGATVAGWPANGVRVRSDVGNDALPTQVLSDGGGGVVVGWLDLRDGPVQSYAQAVDGSGNPRWTTDGVRLTGNVGNALVSDMAYGPNGLFAVWIDGRGSSWDLYAQRLDASGAPQWGVSGTKICGASDTQASASVFPDGANGAYFVWQDARANPLDATYALRVNSAGSLLWSTDGVVPTLASLASASISAGVAHLVWQVAPSAAVTVERNSGAGWTTRAARTADGTGRLAFDDAGLTPGAHVGWRLRLDGGATLAGETWLDVPAAAFALHGVTPNPSVGDLVVSFSLPTRERAAIELLDVQGRRVLNRSLGALEPGEHRVTLEARLEPGLYFARLTQGGRRAVVRFARIE